jgi:hypothetical protein
MQTGPIMKVDFMIGSVCMISGRGRGSWGQVAVMEKVAVTIPWNRDWLGNQTR